MISLESQKSQKLIEQIRLHEKEPLCLEGFLNLDEIQEINQVKESCYLVEERCAEKLITKDKALGKMAHPDLENKARLEKILRPKLKKYMGLPFEMEFSFHRNYFPYGMHTDSGYDPDEYIYKQGIIPLEVWPKGGEVYTIIFKQKAYHSVGFPRNLETIQSLKEEEWSVIYNFKKGAEHDRSIEKYFSGNNSWLNGFEVALAFKWEVGHMALWDRAHLHCSSDFSSVEGKLGLMWVSKIPRY